MCELVCVWVGGWVRGGREIRVHVYHWARHLPHLLLAGATNAERTWRPRSLRRTDKPKKQIRRDEKTYNQCRRGEGKKKKSRTARGMRRERAPQRREKMEKKKMAAARVPQSSGGSASAASRYWPSVSTTCAPQVF